MKTFSFFTGPTSRLKMAKGFNFFLITYSIKSIENIYAIEIQERWTTTRSEKLWVIFIMSQGQFDPFVNRTWMGKECNGLTSRMNHICHIACKNRYSSLKFALFCHSDSILEGVKQPFWHNKNNPSLLGPSSRPSLLNFYSNFLN